MHSYRPERPRYARAALLLLLTFFSTTSLGAYWAIAVRTDVLNQLPTFLDVPVLSPSLIVAVWGDWSLLSRGLAFSLPLLFILLCHELGHYLQCLRYRVAATPPFFLPVPLAFGTLGAFIRIKAPIHSKRALFDIGVSGPLAGFAALLPFLLLGTAWSQPVTISAPLEGQPAAILAVPGRSLALALASRLFHGPLAPDQVLDYHPFALAAWFGLLATALNMLPLGQLDGGHLLYAVAGRRQRQISLVILLAVALLGTVWPGWLVWCTLVVFVIGLRHPPVLDEETPLDRGRVAVAVLALLILALSFTPVPLDDILIALPPGLLPDGIVPAGTQLAGL
ncbi:MAG: site-2 protease family protein [Thermoanaerobaculia bacterium]